MARRSLARAISARISSDAAAPPCDSKYACAITIGYVVALVCSKHKDNTSKYLLRNLLGHHTFGNTKIDFEQMQSNHMKPLFVPASSDSFQAIGKPPTVPGCLSDLMADKWQAVYQEVFPSKGRKDGPADLTMVEAEQFAEESIDTLRKQKREELMKMRKAAEFEKKMDLAILCTDFLMG